MSFKILIVDDFDIIRINLKKIITQAGVESVFEAVDGVDALQKLRAMPTEAGSNVVDLIFLDWNMPRMNGYEFLKECKRDELLRKIPIIMTTAERDRKSVLEALSAGAVDYIVKPFKAFIIVEKLDKFTSAKKVA